MKQRGSKKKVANSLVAMSSAAVLAVYTAGYTRTRAAAERYEAQSAVRRPAVPGAPRRPGRGGALPPAASSVPMSSGSTAPARDTASKPREVAAAEPMPERSHVASDATAPVKPQPQAPAPSPTPGPVAAEPKTTPAAAEPAAPVAAAPVPATPAPAAAPASHAPAASALRDGTYSGYGTSLHGDIRAEVVITGGRIVSATIADCMTRYSCDIIEKLPPEVPARQSPEVDYVTGATESTNAFYYAVVDALAQAQ